MVGLLMAERKKKGTGRTTTAIQIDKDLARKAAVVASHRGMTQSALISPVVREFIEAQYALVSAEIQREVKDRKQHPQ